MLLAAMLIDGIGDMSNFTPIIFLRVNAFMLCVYVVILELWVLVLKLVVLVLDVLVLVL